MALKKVRLGIMVASVAALVIPAAAVFAAENDALSPDKPTATQIDCEGSSTLAAIFDATKGDAENAFDSTHPGLDVRYESSGSGYGLEKFTNEKTAAELGQPGQWPDGEGDDYCDIANHSSAASAKLDPENLAKIDTYVVGKDAVCVIVKDVPAMDFVDALSMEQLAFIYDINQNTTPCTATWDDVDMVDGSDDWTGDSANIVPYSRKTISGTYSTFLDLIGVDEYDEAPVISALEGCISGYARQPENQDMVDRITETGGEYRVAYCGLAYAVAAEGEARAVPIIPAGGGSPVEANSTNIVNGTYPIARDLYMSVLKPEYDDSYKLVAFDFLNWLLSDAGQDCVENAGYVRVNAVQPYWDLVDSGEHVVNYLDGVALGNAWGDYAEPPYIPEDMNADGTVNYLDGVILGNHWGFNW